MKVEATEALPDIRFLDEAARAAGVREDWRDGSSFVMRGTTRNSVIAHARSLERIEQLERERDERYKQACASLNRAVATERQRDAALDALVKLAAFREKEIQGCAADLAQAIGWNSAGRYSRDVARQALAQIDAITEGEGR